MEYLIYRNNPVSQFIHISLKFNCSLGEKVILQLPCWRPGRYEITNYAQKIKGLAVKFGNHAIPFNKVNKDQWQFEALFEGQFTVNYQFHASQMDAGGSWSDDQQLYLNFINFAFELKGREQETVEIMLDFPENYKIATALPRLGESHFHANDFQHLVDCPLIASHDLQHFTYEVNGTKFNLWFQGEIHFNVEDVLAHFKSYTEKQIEAFGEFPVKEYHFLYQLLPYKHYHGVEHQTSTVITFGPAEALKEKSSLDEFIGVSCHELYHSWNVCQIRPKELLPYDFSKEAYIDTGVVAEGVTTYMGDIFLLQSGYFELEDYLKILEKQIKREFESFGWQNQSITESSWDLWLDGYKLGIPDKKVSIYNKGALIAICLDLILLEQESSLHEVMKKMWEKFGKPFKGYSLTDFEKICQSCSQNHALISHFFEEFIYGKKDIQPLLQEQLESININWEVTEQPDPWLKYWGIKVKEDGTIIKIHPQSPAYHRVMLGDKILSINSIPYPESPQPSPTTLNLEIDRFGRILNLQLETGERAFYPTIQLKKGKSISKRKKWLGKAP
ncbi:M61 family peptidase [Echinicola jeungdonensis]|uniref:M61 family metallopeptidase n=1 Tax=Echinicola jeungdonensis TaxID=709343 RepID=A0ABV5J534_9BACT|nr:M61 family peptidase [Echinicola jeungdonensis]MDN3669569.1 M61 family peptidase [Echinicola jeungdonensis]